MKKILIIISMALITAMNIYLVTKPKTLFSELSEPDFCPGMEIHDGITWCCCYYDSPNRCSIYRVETCAE